MKSVVQFVAPIALIAGMVMTSGALAQTVTYKGYDPNSPFSGTAPHGNSDAASASFQSALAGTSTESFESFATGATSPLTLTFAGSAGTLNATLTGSGSVQSGTTYGAGGDRFPTQGTQYYTTTDNNFAIQFGSGTTVNPIAAFGFYTSDIESNVSLTFTHQSGALETFTFQGLFPTVDYTTPFAAPTASVNFLGFINVNDPFTNVTFGAVAGSGDILGFDQMTIGDVAQVVNPPAVPEPATWAMMVGGFGLIGAAMRRRSTVTTFA